MLIPILPLFPGELPDSQRDRDVEALFECFVDSLMLRNVKKAIKLAITRTIAEFLTQIGLLDDLERAIQA